jgi:putative transposase
MPGHSFHSLNYHVVFTTKRRLPLLAPEKWLLLRGFLQEKSEDWGVHIHIADGSDDHVHLLLSCPPRLAVADCVKHLKGFTSRKVDGLYWQNGYYAFTVDRLGFDPVYRYIENQKIHHAKESSRDEIKDLLASAEPRSPRSQGFKPLATNATRE